VDAKALPKFPPVAPQDALKTFQQSKGFRLELVAAEPLITDPIALAFDEDGRLFVVEMNDYPERGEQHLGQVKRLEDTDGDGRFNKATVLAKDLRWPAAIFCYGGGVFVGSTRLLYFKDTDDDGVADQKQIVLTGWKSRCSVEPEAHRQLAWASTTKFTAWSTAFPASSPIPTIPAKNP
jgi:putative membrane-bound dehydrogenase-like protein